VASSARQRIERLIRPEIRGQRAYQVADATGLVKLDAMENPYVWPEALREQWLERLRGVSLNRYPDPAASALRAALREKLGLDAALGLLFGNGSDELIQLLVQGISAPGRRVMAPGPTFVMYRMISAAFGLSYHEVPLAEDFTLDLSAMLAAVEQLQPELLFISYPNNPGGNLFDRADMAAVIEAAPGLVVVDEAYQPFAQSSLLSWLDRYPHLLVLRTFSKSGLAGLRLGYLVGETAWLDEFDKLRLPYNINVLSQESVLFALEHEEMLEEQAAAIRRDRALLHAGLAELDGLQVYPSDANFILFRVADGGGDRVFNGLRDMGILIKNLSPQGGMLSDCLRVTVGRPGENRAFLEALANVLI